MKVTRNRSAGEAQGSQLLGFDDSLAAVRMARQELAARAWRAESNAETIDAQDLAAALANSMWHRSTAR